MEKLNERTSNYKAQLNYTLIIVLVYIWSLIVHPQSRFPVLGEIHFEKILVLIGWIVLILSKKIVFKSSKITILVLIFYALLLVSYFLSPFKEFPLSQYWFENYWKLIVLYFLILFSINSIDDIFFIFSGLVVVVFLYQVHSWFDFFHGGSYVWQAGMKRIVGVWSSGIGAANYFGLIALLSLPFALCWFQTTQKIKIKSILIFYFVISFCSVLYSGTRGATISLFFFILINIRKLKHLKIAVIIFLFLAVGSVLLLPEYLKERYSGLIPWFSKQQAEVSEPLRQQRKKSAESRLTGLIDGWNLAKQKPILGYGPNSSPVARKKVNKELLYDSEYEYHMHNLYGQLLAETGFVGTILFFVIIIVYFYYNRREITENSSKLYPYRIALQNSMLLLLFYGLASHILYRYYWFLLFACQSAFLSIASTGIKSSRLKSA